MALLEIIIAFALILVACELFTNGVEWLGVKLNLTEGATGSILAAVATAMPETMIPVVAILFSSAATADEIGIGAIVGAPFMLATLVMLLIAATAFLLRKRRGRTTLRIDRDHALRDLRFFLVSYSLALLLALVPTELSWLRLVLGALFLPIYAFYLFSVLKPHPGPPTLLEELSLEAELEETPLLKHLTLATWLNRFVGTSYSSPPPTWLVLAQSAGSFGILVLGAHLFADFVDAFSRAQGLSPLLVSLVLAPFATELPEKFNSIIWVRDNKDPIALGNVSGAMVFQSTVPVTIGVYLTPWRIGLFGLVSAVLALVAAAMVYLHMRFRATDTELPLTSLVGGGVLYLLFAALVIALGGTAPG